MADKIREMLEYYQRLAKLTESHGQDGIPSQQHTDAKAKIAALEVIAELLQLEELY